MFCSSSSSLSSANTVFQLQQQLSSSLSFSSNRHPATIIRWGSKRGIDSGSGFNRTKGQVVAANANVTIASGKMKKEVIMVDPVEAKRLAAKQMQEIKKKQKFKRRRQIEAINGAWAMIGLTAGIVVEGQTGHGILAQLTGYWDSVVNIFVR